MNILLTIGVVLIVLWLLGLGALGLGFFVALQGACLFSHLALHAGPFVVALRAGQVQLPHARVEQRPPRFVERPHRPIG